MSDVASYAEIVSYLAQVPAASPSWAEGLYAAKLSLSVVEQLISTMKHDVESPLRRSEENILSREIVRVNQERGAVSAGGTVAGKMPVRVRVVLSPTEQTRVVKIASGFCQPVFETSSRFGRNGHAVMNAVRRVMAAYVVGKVPVGSSVVEVGPDIKNWLLSPTPSVWAGKRADAYVGARPVLGPRDAIRVEWERLASVLVNSRQGFYSQDSVSKAKMLLSSYDALFPDSRVQTLTKGGEYVLSFDSNYDIKFSDMPVTMGVCRARVWYGVMVRAKGLTPTTRLKTGALPLMGVNYRVDWKDGRIDFRHPECSAFGYSHNVWEYMKYEEHNGYVWTTNDCHYVYSKGPETTDELLFFSVVRVPKVHGIYEPRFVENPNAGLVELTSLWSIGDEVSGLPTSFERVVFHVDALNFSKVLEKRRALDHKGSLPITVALVRSTNVRFWLHGTPVGVSNRIEARLADATAIVVESLACENRLEMNLMFDKAMSVYKMNLPKSSWLMRALESVIDMRAVAGSLMLPVTRIWQDIRTAVIDKALSPLVDVHVGVSTVQPHLRVEGGTDSFIDASWTGAVRSKCKCSEVAELRSAMAIATGADRTIIRRYIDTFSLGVVCDDCDLVPERVLEFDSEQASDSGDDSVDSSPVGSSTLQSVDSTNPSDVVSVDCSKHWGDLENIDCVEAKSMREFVEVEEYVARSQKVEIRIDATRIFDSGPVSDVMLRDFATTRTKHAVLEFLSGRCVKAYGSDLGVVSAIYDRRKDEIVMVRAQGSVMYAQVSDGFYYTCNRLKVWNGPALVSSVNYALAYGVVSRHRRRFQVTLGVPGAGKTYGMMKSIADRWVVAKFDFLVLSVTKASALAAVRYGKRFGIPEDVLLGRVMTLDRYLMHKKFPSEVLCVDEYPMVHIGKVDAAVSIADAKEVFLYGDARQIPYDPFCAELGMCYSSLRGSVSLDQVTFLAQSHRLPLDICAMWLDQYPAIYPCECCRTVAKTRTSCQVVKVRDALDLHYDGRTRFHTYKQDERDNLRGLLCMPGDAEQLRALDSGGLATVHEDQGSTHPAVVTVRLEADFDKHASPRNPSLFNRERYVLTDTTRHTVSYRYYTLSEEDDLICKRVRLASDPERVSLVRERKGFGNVSILDML